MSVSLFIGNISMAFASSWKLTLVMLSSIPGCIDVGVSVHRQHLHGLCVFMEIDFGDVVFRSRHRFLFRRLQSRRELLD